MSEWQEPSVKAWAKHVVDEMVPKMKSSAVVCEIVPSEDEIDPKFCVELGAAIMLDKPIISVAFARRSVPPKLAAVSDEIVRLPDGVNPESSRELAEAIERVMRRALGG